MNLQRLKFVMSILNKIKMKTTLISIGVVSLFTLFSFISKPEEAEKKEINWLTITEAYKMNQKEPRKIFVDCLY